MLRLAAPVLIVLAAIASPALAQQSAAVASSTPARCGGLLCDLYYAGKPAPSPDQAPLPGQVASSESGAAPVASQSRSLGPLGSSLPCRDFICGMFGGRTQEAPAAEQSAVAQPVAVEPADAVTAKAAKKRRRATAQRTPAPAEVR